ncbi:PREDICTED: uncharacterized protein LOC105556362, partial [Vollenhovia emeryi]|uniref:uncharacterized protein LOC105556362 n=1 Tax=Vollenhovia emeryi TaxID=411798 RepID=UPI0005F58DA7
METQSIYCAQTATKVILSTIKVHAYDSEGKVQACRALLDPGSQTNILTTSLTNKLKLVCNKEERPITGIGRTETRFWTQEETPGTPQLSEEERKCEQLFKTTFKRDETGRFLVRLPARTDVRLGNSREFALKRFISLERRLARDPDLRLEYCKFMQDYLSQGHMTLVEDENQKSEHYVLPHQAVVRPDSVTTKLRVVFDASAKTTANTSLNDKLIAGPNLQGNLISIILRFRTYEHVVTADIASMFRQILVAEEDRSLQQILWRSNPEEPVRRYQLNTVTYGTNCAPYLAIRCLRQIAEDDGGDLPQAAHAIIEDCYMDDVLSGARTVEEAI